MRHQMSSPLISAEEKKQSGVKGPENTGLPSARRLHFFGVQALGDRSRMVLQSDVRSQENPGQASGD